MAGTRGPIEHHVIGSAVLKPSKSFRGAASFSVSISAKRNGAHDDLALAEGPSCIFVGPLESASRETLEALYRQARDAYYSGKPLILDDMFDRVELKLRSYGSKSVVKYPRCSLRRQSTYADAEEDISQAFALASIWILFLVIGCSASLVPIIYTVGLAYRDSFDSVFLHDSQGSASAFLSMANGVLFVAVGLLIGYPIIRASVKVLQRLWTNNLVALKGPCPNCGEEVFAFVRSDQPNDFSHGADCHVCESSLVFRTKVEKAISGLGRKWVYGRIYLASQSRRNWRQRWM
ncbi:PGR5-like protein 1B, chloroplastic [Tripterygium wilfordii]|uniref:PGR5-like protein 1B, chloroplastic n=1 Tax=Tripterygium wilfordii TaxID=458696 RepID=UPI0018F82DF5|nr:PGR5-like protein 1B, chloroplastic [Tripterygium wilfordii]